MNQKDGVMMHKWTRKAVLLLGLSAGMVLGGGYALAEAPAPSSPAPSNNAMVNLVRLLVAQGTISKDKGDALIAQAVQEAEQARSAELAAAQPAAAQPAPAQIAVLPAPPAGTIRVPYIPEAVRKSIRDDIRADVMREAKAEGWAAPGEAAPDWTRRITLGGDLRLRSQSQFYSRFNATDVPNFQAVVANGPLDLLTGNIPFENTTQDKYGLMLARLRFNVDAKITDRISAGFQIATGNDANPVSEKATLGGDFFKHNIYVTRAYVAARVTDWSKLTAGRFAVPFVATDAMFAPDLNFDGVTGEITMRDRAFGHADFKLRGGIFPLDFGDQNFPDTSTVKTSSPQKWLMAGQIETDWRLGHGASFDMAAAYYYFANVSGRISAPCALGYGVTQCSTDGFAPYYVQQGNSLFQMRDIVNASGTAVDGPQLLGLVQRYHVLDVIGTVHVPVSAHTEFSVMGEYLDNLAFRRSRACRYGLAGEPVNNGGAGGSGNICDTTPGNATPYVAGHRGFQIMTGLGYPVPDKWGEWRVFAGYKYLQSDVTLDALNDPDFHLGGTNAKGFILGGTLGLAHNVRAGVRWLSTNQVSGDPLAIDVLQIDLNVAF
jgi:xanthosine utilization system XapX-like protein